MTRRSDIERLQRSIDEIRVIMYYMKNLALMETNKISSFLDVQHSVVKHIETVATDFLHFYPDALIENTDAPIAAEVYLLIGAERVYCGDFNHALLRHLETIPPVHDVGKLKHICDAHKLQQQFENENRELKLIDFSSV